MFLVLNSKCESDLLGAEMKCSTALNTRQTMEVSMSIYRKMVRDTILILFAS